MATHLAIALNHMNIQRLQPNDYCAPEPVWHAGMIQANQTVEWITSDTQENYRSMLQQSKHQEYFKHMGWDQPGSITYRINRAGFRGDEFPMGDCVLTLGCSFTFGVGLPEQDVWPYLLAAACELPAANISWPGAAADTCVRWAAYWVPHLRPRLVVMLAPPPDRFEIFLDEPSAQANLNHGVEVIMPQSLGQEFAHDRYIRHYYLNKQNSAHNRMRNILSLRQICSDHGVPCLIYCCFNAFGRSREEVGYARDYMHAGPPGHQRLVDQIVKDWNEIKHA